jgi:DNA-binding LacI/PurR family transcriptional regulator
VTVSIKDVAKMAHRSYSTVSRALNNSPRVNSDSKAHIQRIAAEMGYPPCAADRSLVTRRTHTLDVVVKTTTGRFLAEEVSAIEATALLHGCRVILCNSGAEPERELRTPPARGNAQSTASSR